MRDVILYMSMSVDGFVGSDREHAGVAIPEGAELKQWKLDRISRAGAHLMGRTSYQEMSSYWPASDDEYAAPMNDIP
jgi:dihydrofolate reductase